MFEGYLELGGNEILNSARTIGYMNGGDCPSNWIICPPCEGVSDANGDSPYVIENIDEAPWYDVEYEPSHRFYGAHAISITGVEDSTRTATISEGILDGGVVGNVRHAVRQVRVRALLSGRGEDAIEAGLGWLKAALDPDSCGLHGNSCGAVDSCFYAACPPSREQIVRPITSWSDTVTNLATNPSMETAGPAVVVRTNMVTNPSFEATTASTVEVRRNHNTNPKMENSTAGWTVAGTGVTQTAAVGGTVVDFANNVANGASWMYQAANITAAPGEAWVSSLEFTVPAGFPAVGIIVSQRTYSGPGTDSDGTAVTVQPGTTVRIPSAVLASVPAGQVGIRTLIKSSGTIAAGSRLIVRNALIENTPVLGTYFDGSTVPAGDFTHAWTGTANASASVQYGTAVVGGISTSSATTAVIQSTAWASTGAVSMRIIPKSTNLVTRAYVQVSSPMAGKRITVQAKIRLAAPLTGTLNGATRTFLIFTDTGSGYVNPVYAPTAPNEAGVYTLSASMDVDPAAIGLRVYLYNGAGAGGGDVWWDDLLVMEGNYTGPYFDGSTPAKARRNLVPNPHFDSVGAGWSNRQGGTGATSTGVYFPSGGPTESPAYFRATKTAMESSGSPWLRVSYEVKNAIPVTEGNTYTFTAWGRTNLATGLYVLIVWRNTAGGTVSESRGTTVAAAPGQWARLTGTDVAPPGATSVYLQVAVASAVVNDWVDAAGGLFEQGAVAGTFFGGSTPLTNGLIGAWEGTANSSASYLTDPDLTNAWTGTANASTSTQSAPSVAQYSISGAIAAFQSKAHVQTRTASARTIANAGTTSGDLRFLGGNTITFPLGMQAGKTYTVSALMYMPVANTVNDTSVASRQRRITLYISINGSAQYTPMFGPQAANVAGWQTVSHTFTIPADATGGILGLGAAGNGVTGVPHEAWWDDVFVVEGELYSGGYFDGTYPDSPPDDFKIIGNEVTEYAWTGTPDASASTWKTGTIFGVQDPVAWGEAVSVLGRRLHNVTCISGPLIEQKFRRDDMYGVIVEFTLAAATPWVFSDTEHVDLPPSLPIVVQDVPYNLVPVPSAELASGVVVVSTNLATNPSAEANATGWSWVSDGTKMVVGNGTIAVSTELKAVGAQSIKATYTAPATNTDGWFGTNQVIDLPGITATTRYSVNLWSVASVQSGTAVLGDLEIHVYWQNAASSTLRDDTIYKGSSAGGATSVSSVLPPAGTAKVIVRAFQRVTSWNSGAVIRLYADALAVTNP